MNIKNILKNDFVFTILQIVFITIGLLMFLIEINHNINFGDNVWNARMYKFLAISFIGLGTAMTGKLLIQKIKRFIFIFGILFLCLLFLGGGLVLNDMLNENNYVQGNLWIAFDCGMLEISEISIIGNIIPIIVCGIIVSYGIYMFFFQAENRTEKIQFLIHLSLPIFIYIIWNFV